MGPGEGATEQDLAHAYELGQLIARAGWVLLTGGRNAGVMEAASRGAKQAGGLTLGILPGSDRQGMSSAIDLPILTGLGQARNWVNVLSSQVIIACGTGAGTVSEVAFALKLGKPVIFLGFSPLGKDFFRELGQDRVWEADTPPAAIALAHTCLEPS